MKIKVLVVLCLFGSIFISFKETRKEPGKETKRPNILFCIADDWGWPHAGAYGDSAVKTPAFDRLAREGVLFERAFVSSPSCTPSRNAILTGQDFWRLKEGANLWSTLDVNIPVYPLLLEKAGYFTGSWRKSWGPGNLVPGGYVNHKPAGKEYKKGFEAFLEERPADQPFCFWLGASDPHRGYEKGSGAASGINVKAVKVPGFYPDVEEIRSDLADYYFEVQRFDADIAAALKLLERKGELDNTIIIVTGDHGMPFPRCKANLYDMGTRVPLVIRWGNNLKKGARLNDFVSFTDMAPTFLELAGVPVPREMTGRSLKPLLLRDQNEKYNTRDFIVFGRERHTPAQAKPSNDGYPARAIRTDDFLYIHNLLPQRWPAGVPEGATHPSDRFADADDGPTKAFLIDHKNSYRKYYDLSFGPRPEEELYDVKNDPFQLVNLAGQQKYQSVKKTLSAELRKYLENTKDPRVTSSDVDFDKFKYWGPERKKGEH